MPSFLFQTLWHPWLLLRHSSPSSVWHLHYALPLLPFSVQKHTTTSAARAPFLLAIHVILPHSSPLASLFFPLRLKGMRYFQPWLCGVDRESRTMAAFQSSSAALGGGPLAASIFLYCQFKQANAASLLLSCLVRSTELTKWKTALCDFVFVCLHFCALTYI